MTEFALALIGGGSIARTHVAAIKDSRGRIALAAVVDPSEPARQMIAQATGASPFVSIEQLLASPVAQRIRGVLICTPPDARLPIVQAALKHGLAVLVEKPLAHNLDDARKLNELAVRHSELVTAVGYCHRFTPAIVEMKRLIDAGKIGQVARFENTFTAAKATMRSHWMSDPMVSGGGSLIDTGSHGMDLFLHLLGEGEVIAAAFHRAWPGRGESCATVLLRQAPDRAPGGASAGEPRPAGVIQSGWLEPARSVVTIAGTRGLLHYDYNRPTELLHRTNDGAAQRIAVSDPSIRFTHQLQAFADASDNGARSSLAGFRDALVTAALVDAAYKAEHDV